jgi:hypothetical protein
MAQQPNPNALTIRPLRPRLRVIVMWTSLRRASFLSLSTVVFADGSRIGSMADLGSTSGVWSIQHLTHTGPNTITVKAVDAAGNRSAPSTGPSTTNVVTGYPC